MDIQHLSYSSISAYLACPANWKFKYIDKLTAPAGPALLFGSALHDTIDARLASKGNENQPNYETIWQTAWAKQIEKNPNCDWGLEGQEKYFNDGIRMLQEPEITQTIDSIIPQKRGEGMAIEQKVSLAVPGVPIPVIGFIDVITQDGIPADIKTSARSWSNEQALSELQPLFYLAALNQAGIPTPGYRFRHYVFVKTKTPKVQIIECAHNIGKMMFLFQMIANVWKAIEQEVFPENPTGWKCDPRYCDYYKNCRGKYE